jgi:hypothetical protein
MSDPKTILPTTIGPMRRLLLPVSGDDDDVSMRVMPG